MPDTECLKDTIARVMPYWEEAIVPELKARLADLASWARKSQNMGLVSSRFGAFVVRQGAIGHLRRPVTEKDGVI